MEGSCPRPALLAWACLFFLGSFMSADARKCPIYFKRCSEIIKMTHCMHIGDMGATLSWTYHAKKGSMDMAFKAKPSTKHGWVAWGLNPSRRGMVGTQALLALIQPNGTMFTGNYTAVSNTRATAFIPTTYTSHGLHFQSQSSGFRNGTITIYATVLLPSNKSIVNQAWQVGSKSIGRMRAFQITDIKSFGTIDLLTGKIPITPTPPHSPSPPPRTPNPPPTPTPSMPPAAPPPHSPSHPPRNPPTPTPTPFMPPAPPPHSPSHPPRTPPTPTPTPTPSIPPAAPPRFPSPPPSTPNLPSPPTPIPSMPPRASPPPHSPSLSPSPPPGTPIPPSSPTPTPSMPPKSPPPPPPSTPNPPSTPSPPTPSMNVTPPPPPPSTPNPPLPPSSPTPSMNVTPPSPSPSPSPGINNANAHPTISTSTLSVITLLSAFACTVFSTM